MRSAVVRAERKSKIGEDPLLDEHQDQSGTPPRSNDPSHNRDRVKHGRP
jgi:hypothetical protein